jgi:hypothetical protein
VQPIQNSLVLPLGRGNDANICFHGDGKKPPRVKQAFSFRFAQEEC